MWGIYRAREPKLSSGSVAGQKSDSVNEYSWRWWLTFVLSVGLGVFAAWWAVPPFAHLLAREMAPRLGLACAVEAAPQPALTEPLVRVNSDPWITPGWPAEAFWDDYAAYYRRIAAAGLLSAPA